MIYSERIFITGGAGFLGKNLIKRWYKENEITIYSRDEAKHYFLKKQYPRIKCIVGDVRNYELLRTSMEDARASVGIFAASMKQIEACDENYEEANQIIVQGAFNSKNAARYCELESACFISSDKSRAASTIYGSMKHTAGESFISNNTEYGPKFSTAIYGNILNSTGSIIPLIWDSIKNNRTLELYDPEMTRFALSVDQGIDLIETALECKNVNVIPDSISFKIIDLFDIYRSKFGLKYKVTAPRPNEKIHEIMASAEEVPRLTPYKDVYLMEKKPNRLLMPLQFPNNEYSSKDRTVSFSVLDEMLKDQFDYFRP